MKRTAKQRIEQAVEREINRGQFNRLTSTVAIKLILAEQERLKRQVRNVRLGYQSSRIGCVEHGESPECWDMRIDACNKILKLWEA